MRYQGVIFDMDGTLVASPLDFARIRGELGVPPDSGILEALDARPAEQRDQGHRRLLEMELQAAEQAVLIPHATETLDQVRRAGLKTALLTRNCAQSMALILKRFPELSFDLAWSRENGPIKPEPDGVLKACRTLGIQPADTACVGDFRLDLVAANAAGTTSILLTRGEVPPWADLADVVIRCLSELPAVLGL